MSNAEDHAQGYHLDSSHDPDDALRKIKTTGSLSISPELFEKIYLSPQNKVAGELRKTVGNPTPVALVGFLLCLSPLSCDLMQWLGAGGNGAAGIGFYIGFGGICMILGGIGEWILGNTFPATVFTSFGGFWIAFAITLMPNSGTITDYAALGEGGLYSKGFNASFAFILVFMDVLVTVYCIVSVRTNMVFLAIFILLIPTFACLTYVFYGLSIKPIPSFHQTTLHVAGALAFVISMLGWYILGAILLASVDFPFSLPVGDLSGIIKGASEKGNTGATEA